jgi:hypothetical protein
MLVTENSKVQKPARALYKMGVIAQLTGFSPAVLRAWERRYALLEPERTAGGHRLYTDSDLQVLLYIRDRMSQGHSIGRIASEGRSGLLVASAVEGVSAELVQEGLVHNGSRSGRDNLAIWRTQVVDAAVAIDGPALERTLDRAFETLAPRRVAQELIRPAAYSIGQLWARGACTEAGEHLSSAIFIRRLLNLVEVERRGPTKERVLCACFPDEYHALGAVMFAYDLASARKDVHYLGAALPFASLERACASIEPEEVFLSVTQPLLYRRHRRELVDTVMRLEPSIRVHVGGQGSPRTDPEVEAVGIELWSLARMEESGPGNLAPWTAPA